MKFLKNIATAAAVLGVVTLAQSAQAFSITSGSVLSLSSGTGGVTVNPSSPAAGIDFYGAGGVGSLGSGSVVVNSTSTGSFAPLATTLGLIRDITPSVLADLAAGNPVEFLNLNNLGAGPADNISFFLTGVTNSVLFPLSSSTAVAFAQFTGQFTNVTGDVIGLGEATATLFNATNQVPTPALIPGIAAMGMGLLRRKKAQQAAA
jgi:hypothetical protein